MHSISCFRISVVTSAIWILRLISQIFTLFFQGYLFCTFAEFFNSAKNSQDCEKWKNFSNCTTDYHYECLNIPVQWAKICKNGLQLAQMGQNWPSFQRSIIQLAQIQNFKQDIYPCINITNSCMLKLLYLGSLYLKILRCAQQTLSRFVPLASGYCYSPLQRVT